MAVVVTITSSLVWATMLSGCDRGVRGPAVECATRRPVQERDPTASGVQRRLNEDVNQLGEMVRQAPIGAAARADLQAHVVDLCTRAAVATSEDMHAFEARLPLPGLHEEIFRA